MAPESAWRLRMPQPWSFSLFSDAEPLRLEGGLPCLGRFEAEVGRLVDVFERHLTATQSADEGQERRTLLGIVHGRPDLVGDHTRTEGRAERIIPVDDADGLGALEHVDHLLRREGPEPARPDEPHLHALGPHVADTDLEGQRDGAMPMRRTSASSVMYSSNHGFSGPRPKVFRKSA